MRAASLFLCTVLFSLVASAQTTVRHALWDSAQKPLYAQCAKHFEGSHPGIRIKLQQQGWDDYWQALSTGFVADTAPDVFTNHLTKFAEQVGNGVLVDLQPLIARDGVNTAQYEPGLLENWQRRGLRSLEQFAMPADWDTVALAVNLEMVRAAGVAEAELQQLTWNPRDGGSFQRLAERLTRDRAGRHAGQAGFDKTQVVVHGYQTPGAGGMFGQSEWSHFAVSAGFRYQAEPWKGPLRYDDPVLADTLSWLFRLSQQGISATPQALGRLGADAMFTSQRVAMVPVGSWMVGHFTRNLKFAHAYVPLPLGPSGRRATMLNGLGHSLWQGSKVKKAAWDWVKFLGSPACQAQVAVHGVVYPAVRGLGEVAAQAQRRGGARPEAFFQMAREHTFAPPIADHSAQITDLIGRATDDVLLGQRPAPVALREANVKANKLLVR